MAVEVVRVKAGLHTVDGNFSGRQSHRTRDVGAGRAAVPNGVPSPLLSILILSTFLAVSPAVTVLARQD